MTAPPKQPASSYGAGEGGGVGPEDRWLGVRRLGIELVDGTGGSPRFLDDGTFAQLIAYIDAAPALSILEVGVLEEPTRHPNFFAIVHRLSTALPPAGGELRVWVNSDSDPVQMDLARQLSLPVHLLPLPQSAPAWKAPFNAVAAAANPGHVSPLARPDDPSVDAGAVRGGCILHEQDALFCSVTGEIFQCQRRQARGEALGRLDSAGPGSELEHNILRLRRPLRLDRRDAAGGGCVECRLSCASILSPTQLREFWLDRDDAQGLAGQDVRSHIFNDVLAVEHRVLRLDIGCGPVKRPGFIGVDRFPQRGVDIVADIGANLPFADDSIDYVIASHSLEHILDTPTAMQELFRICKDGALLTITGPYANTRLNEANPYHLSTWNEHTPRFFTNAPDTLLPFAEYTFPSAEMWGLASSDHSNFKVDFRCISMDFLYMPAYRGLAPETQRLLRKTLSDVCDQFVMHLIAVKSPQVQTNLAHIAANTRLQEPPAFKMRRLAEAQIGSPNLITQLIASPREIDSLSKQVDDLRALHATTAARLTDLAAFPDQLTAIAADSKAGTERSAQGVEQVRAQIADFSARAQDQGLELSRALSALSDRVSALDSVQQQSAVRRHATLTAELARATTRIKAVATTLDRHIEAYAGFVVTLAEARRNDAAQASASFSRLTADQLELRSEASRANDLWDARIRMLEEGVAHLPGLEQRALEAQAQIATLAALTGRMAADQSVGSSRLDAFHEVTRDILGRLTDEAAERGLLEQRTAAGHQALARNLSQANAALRAELADAQARVRELSAALTQERLKLESYAEDGRAASMATSEHIAALADGLGQLRPLSGQIDRISEAFIAAERDLPRPAAMIWKWLTHLKDERKRLLHTPYAGWIEQAGRLDPRERVQLGPYWRPGDVDEFILPVAAGLTSLSLAAWRLLPRAGTGPVAGFTIDDAEYGVLAQGVALACTASADEPLALEFEAVDRSSSTARLRLTGLPGVETVGLKLYERRIIERLTHRIRHRHPLADYKLDTDG